MEVSVCSIGRLPEAPGLPQLFPPWDTGFLQIGSPQWQKPATSITKAGLVGLDVVEGLCFGQNKTAGKKSHQKKSYMAEVVEN